MGRVNRVSFPATQLILMTLCVMPPSMIVGFRDAETEKIWFGVRSRRLPYDIQAVALRKLRLLNAAKRLDDLRVPPGNRLEALKRNRTGSHQ